MSALMPAENKEMFCNELIYSVDTKKQWTHVLIERPGDIQTGQEEIKQDNFWSLLS